MRTSRATFRKNRRSWLCWGYCSNCQLWLKNGWLCLECFRVLLVGAVVTALVDMIVRWAL